MNVLPGVAASEAVDDEGLIRGLSRVEIDDQAEWDRLMAEEEADGLLYIANSWEFIEEYYAAEEAAREAVELERGVVCDPIPQADVLGYLVLALGGIGHESAPPPVVFDRDDDDGWVTVGLVDEAGIHYNPRVLDPWTLLHELAHWLDDKSGHSHRWAYYYAELATAIIGQDAGNALRAEFDARELPHHW